MADNAYSQVILGDFSADSEPFSNRHQPLCRDPEGWGPISSGRYDFTPCFMDTWILFVSVWGLLMGAGALWLLLRRRTAQPVQKNWHFYAKLSLIWVIFFLVALQASLQVESFPGVWFQDFRFWSTILLLASLVVIYMAQYYEHWRSRQPNGVVLFYWVFYIIAHAVKLRSLISRKAYQDRLPYFVIFNVNLGVAILEFVLEYMVPKKQSAYDALGDEDECPYEYADIFSVLTFSWMTPLMKYGYKNFLTQDDLWNLRKRDTTRVTGDQLEKVWDAELKKKGPSLWRALFKAFGGPYFRGALVKTWSDIFAFAQPQLLRFLILFIDSYRGENPQPVVRGLAIALGMFGVSVVQTICLHQYFQRAFETGMRVKSSLTAMIYTKSLKLSNEGRASKSTGDIVNYMAVDQQRLSDLAQFGMQLWSAPFQIVLCMVSLYQLVGLSMLAGIGAMILMIPLNGLIAKVMKNLQIKQMRNKDRRTRLMTEILNNMKSIKLYAWNAAFMNMLNHVRNDLELNTLRKIGATQSVANFTWSSTPFLVSCSTFAVFVLTNDKPLTTEIVFPALTLFNLLTFPLSILPMVITSIIEASVAVNRLKTFFTADELQTDAVLRQDPVSHGGDESVRIRDATFTWDRHEGRRVLENIDFSARKGELSCIVGRVGAGKSSLLQALLGDLWKINGEVIMRGRVAYVAQQAWVMNASVRENIVFGHRWDPHFYNLTVEACALLDDFQILPDGDQTEVGERGISLSGGQKARLTLARAVYARADIYLLDDVLSAVDQHVGRHIINRVLGRTGILCGKTRILATNSIPVLKEADFIGLLRSGTIIEKGTYEQLLAMKGEVAGLVRSAVSEDGSASSESTREDDSPRTSEALTAIETSDDENLSEVEEAQERLAPLAPMRSGGGTIRRGSMATLRRASTASPENPRTKFIDEETGIKTKQTKEVAEQGKVKWSVYGEYAKTSNLYAVALYLVALLAAHSMQVAGSFWLKKWSEINEIEGRNPSIGKYIGIYFAFGIGSSALVILQTLILWIFCSIEASRKLHERMAFAIFRSPMSFFETTPAGRILNRFSSDIYRGDRDSRSHL
ncbi:bile pigment transporter 1 [Coccidioides immitis RMSCC 3703]|uniref:Bile pigment transporter 1 n=1 Tax=Coccidioides immitis RMSCC 3703 TaxID=454286 RepID=A0A0J8QN71_COCIT|nr:bile pigment transporter 1 [Coccidioides immitis RMSCC 3703]